MFIVKLIKSAVVDKTAETQDVFGIARKVILWMEAGAAGTSLDWLFYLGWFFYILNIVEISIDMALYFRNVKLDKAREKA